MSDFKKWLLIYLTTAIVVIVPSAAVWWFALDASSETIVLAIGACVLGALIAVIRRYRHTKRQTLST